MVRYLLTAVLAAAPVFADIRAELQVWIRSEAGQYAVAHGLYKPSFESTGLQNDLEVFAAAKATVERLNREHPLAHFSVETPFALLTNAQFAAWVGPEVNSTRPSPTELAAPASLSENAVDWTQSGCVGPVKAQGGCGSCFAFAAVAAAESAYCLANGRRLTTFSEQQVTSCGPGYGCGGGSAFDSLKWAAAQGLCTDAAYPYTNGNTATTQQCQRTCSQQKLGFTDVVSVSGEGAIEAALNEKPVTIRLHGGSEVFQYYKGGIISSGCPVEPNHAVLAVGYGSAEAPFFKLKNSWGSWWGEGGYVRLRRGVGGLGTCGMARMATYPVATSLEPSFNLMTRNNLMIAEHYSNLFANPKSGLPNENWQSHGFQIIVNSNGECLDAFSNGAGGYTVHTFKCDKGNGNQKWIIDSLKHRIQHATHDNLCLDVDPAQNNKVQVWTCFDDAPNQWIVRSEEKIGIISMQGRLMTTTGDAVSFASAMWQDSFYWTINNVDHTMRANNGKCIDAFEPKNGGTVHLWDCDGGNANQKWIYDASTHQFRHATHTGFCLDMGSATGERAHLWTCDASNSLQQFYYVG
ncbi:cysteine protease family C01A [Achlya hypogyna]|uniref:Cysteine protease family C01A n=1 Tax=Achlya hypogyna TaxID=1202772 RepID=A0A0A7CP75_ACHHY|nr:secreted protein [Achlya hypogyna]OQR85086.1 cysteine protease family C01A [Achlya hypogyna]